MGDQAISERQARLWFWAILLLAVALRAWTFRPYAIHHPDELYQYLEAAHRLTFGSGIISWEYRAGMRGWLPPLFLGLPMRIGELVAPGGLLPVILARASVALVEVAPAVGAYFLGARLSRLHGLVAAAVIAVWFESIYYSGHVLTEVLAVACFLPGAALIRPDASRRALATGGALLALAALFRFHYAPALAIFALVTLGKRWRDLPPVLVGGLVVLAVSAMADIAMGQLPFGWIAANIDHNIVKGASERFGVLGPFAYFQMMWLRWGFAAPLLLVLPLMMARRFPGLFWAAVANLLVHMAIGHKEYRFIWLTTQIFVLLSTIASVELLSRALERRNMGRRAGIAAAVVLVAGWAAASAALAQSDRMWPNWNRFGARMAAMAEAGRQDGLCGVAVHDLDFWTGSHTYLRRSVPLYLPFRRNPKAAAHALATHTVAYNVIVAPANSKAEIPRPYRQVACQDDGNERVCVYRRPGGCSPAGAEAELLQNVITRSNY